MSGILVVEDDPTSRTIVERVLQNQGYQVDAFESPVRALSQLKTTRYDVIISDYFMPEMNGDQLLREVRATDRDTPFLFLTANTDVKLAVELVKAGAGAAGGDGTVAVDRELLEMVITAGAGQKEIFDYVTFIAGLESMPLETSSISISDLVGEVETQAATLLGEDSQDRSLHVMRSSEEPVGSITGDQEYLSQAIHELLVNAMKYSPPKGRIVIGFCRNRDSQDYLDLTVSNTARPAQAMDRDGEPVFGIPYDFSELVFDLFYTIDAFQTEHPRERWGYGTGLYVVRKLIKRHGGWITAGNGVDYTGGVPETIVRVTMTLPIAKEG